MTATANSGLATATPLHSRFGDGTSHFPVSTAVLERTAALVLDAARAGGATAAETEVSQAVGQSVTVRKGDVETIAYNRDKGVGVTVYVGARRGHASTADFSDDSISATVDKALAIARYTAEDPCAGLADPDRLAGAWPDLDLYHPWDLSVDEAVEVGRETEAAALAVDARLANSEGATVSRGNRSSFTRIRSVSRAATAVRGIRSTVPSSARPTGRCSVISGTRRRARRRISLHPTRSVASQANAPCAGLAAANSPRWNVRYCSKRRRPPICSVHSSTRCQAAACIASRRSCSIRSASQVFAPHVNIREEPHLLRGRGSAPFDNEGVATKRRDVVGEWRRAGLFPRQLFGAEARAAIDRQRGRRAQPRRARNRGSAGVDASDGPRPLRHRTAGSGRQSRSPATIPAARPASGSRTARSRTRSRRSRSPAT